MTVEFDKQLHDTQQFFGDLRFILDQTIQNDAKGYLVRLMIFKDLVKKNAKFDLKNHGYSASEIGRISLYHGKKFGLMITEIIISVLQLELLV